MAGNSLIGALRVVLGLDTAQFESGMKQAQGTLGKFGVQLTYSLNGIAEKVGELIGSFPAAIKHAVDHADALSKAAQKAGVTVEALSRLEYAAKFSDVSLESLTGGLGKLSKAMADAVITPTSTAATAFKALGISITDSSGKLRPASDVVSQIADRFAHLEDGSTKTALAMQLFGKSGAQLIPLLNTGATGLKDMADESDRLGETVSTKTATAANKFNDTLTKIGSIVDGLVNKIMEQMLPTLQSLANVFADQDLIDGIAGFIGAIVSGVGQIADIAATAFSTLNKFRDFVQGTLYGDQYMSPAGIQTKIDDDTKSLAALRKQWDDLQTSLTGGAGDAAIHAKAQEIAGKAAGYQNEIYGLQQMLPATASSPGTPPASGTPLKIDLSQFSTQAQEAAKAYQKLLDSSRDRIAQSNIEAEALGKTALEADKLRFSNDLLTEATKNGTKITAAQRTELLSLADQMAMAADKTRQLTQIYDTGKEVFGSFFSDLKSDLSSGASLWQSFADSVGKALGSIADKLLSLAANQLWDSVFGAIFGGVSGGGSWNIPSAFKPGGFFPSFAGGGYTGGGSRAGGIDGMGGFAAILHPNESVVDHSAGDGLGGMNISLTVHADSATNGAAVGRAVVDELRKRLPDAVASYNRNPYRRATA